MLQPALVLRNFPIPQGQDQKAGETITKYHTNLRCKFHLRLRGCAIQGEIGPKAEEMVSLLVGLERASGEDKSSFHNTLEFLANVALRSGLAGYSARTMAVFMWTFAHLQFPHKMFLNVSFQSSLTSQAVLVHMQIGSRTLVWTLVDGFQICAAAWIFPPFFLLLFIVSVV